MAQLTKSDVAAYMRTVQADAGRAAVIRGAAKIAADGIETNKVDKMLRELKDVIDNVSNANTTVVAAVFVAGALTMVGSPDLPAADE
jgi:predicted lysophospholipase L1 biosynthesis ABC-type transport system permease subunit